MINESKNVFGEELLVCGTDPLTGYFRDGCCNTRMMDTGTHTVCAVMTDEFLEFTKSKGNDLSTPIPHFQFPGLKAGDHWCLCVNRWKQALDAGLAPPVLLEATHEKSLEVVSIGDLVQHALKKIGG